ncbi:Osiris 16-like protein [Camponotus japonicus]
MELRKAPVERRIFNLKKNGFKIDVKVVPSPRNDSMKNKDDDYFPEFPVKDIGKCVIEFSLGCIRKRFVRFLETITRLDEITLLGQDVKLVKIRTINRSDGRALNNTDISIERSLDDFFNSFTLRITLPRWNKREKNQIDLMYDETAIAEGRGKKDKCGGGCGGGGKGGKCQMMMMGMIMMVKMKLIGLMAMKSMMMGGMSLMLSMMMLMSKFGKGGGGGGGGGPWQGGGGGGGQLKEIVLLTKASGGGGGGGPSDSYGAPPPSSYGPPSGGGGGYGGGGGGWGRSFHKRPMMLSYDKVIKDETADDGSNRTPMIGEAMSDAESIDYPDSQDYQKSPSEISSNSMISNLNIANYNTFHEYGDANVTADSVKNNSKNETTVNTKERSFIFNRNPSINLVNVNEKNIDSMTSTNQPDVTHKKDMTYDEWQATAEKINHNKIPANSNVKIELQTESHSKNVPLLHGI